MAFLYAPDNLEQQPYIYYLEQYIHSDPHEISGRTQIPYYDSIGAFRLRFLEQLYEVSYPDFTVRHLEKRDGPFPLEENVYAKILLLRYFLEGDCHSTSGNMLAYRDLLWGEIYQAQFQTRCLNRLAAFATQPKRFQRAMECLYAVPVAHGDLGYQFELLHDLFMCFLIWHGDEEYPPSAQILFSDNFPMAFTAEDAAQAAEIVLDYMEQSSRGD